MSMPNHLLRSLFTCSVLLCTTQNTYAALYPYVLDKPINLNESVRTVNGSQAVFEIIVSKIQDSQVTIRVQKNTENQSNSKHIFFA